MSTVIAQALPGNPVEITMFWILAVVAVGSAIALVTMRNVVHAALMLVLNLLAIAGLYLVLESSFLAIVQVIVYAGAIMVLFLFVIMLLGVSRDDALMERSGLRRAGAWVLTAAFIGVITFAFVGPYTSPASNCGPAPAVATPADPEAPSPPPAPRRPGSVACRGLAAANADADDSSVVLVAETLFTRYTFVFEFISLLLIVAIAGALVMARRREVS